MCCFAEAVLARYDPGFDWMSGMFEIEYPRPESEAPVIPYRVHGCDGTICFKVSENFLALRHLTFHRSFRILDLKKILPVFLPGADGLTSAPVF